MVDSILTALNILFASCRISLLLLTFSFRRDFNCWIIFIYLKLDCFNYLKEVQIYNVEIPILNTAPSESIISYKEPIEWSIQFSSINNIFGNSSMMINSLGEASDCHRMELKNADIVANKSPI